MGTEGNLYNPFSSILKSIIYLILSFITYMEASKSEIYSKLD